MDTKKRRGPRHRTGHYLPSPHVRESLNDVLARRLSLSAGQVEALRYEWPGLIADAIRIMRERGELHAAAAIQAKIEEACAGSAFQDVTAAFDAENRAESELNIAEMRYAFTKSEADRREVLRLSAREMGIQAERDNLLRQAGTR